MAGAFGRVPHVLGRRSYEALVTVRLRTKAGKWNVCEAPRTSARDGLQRADALCLRHACQ